MPAEGSSSSSSLGRLISARQISIRRRSIIGMLPTASNMRSASGGSKQRDQLAGRGEVGLALPAEGARAGTD